MGQTDTDLVLEPSTTPAFAPEREQAEEAADNMHADSVPSATTTGDTRATTTNFRGSSTADDRLLAAAGFAPSTEFFVADEKPADKAPGPGGDKKRSVIPPTPVEQQKRIDELLEKMGADTFLDREDATAEMLKIGSPALEKLAEAKRKSPDAEIRARARSAENRILNQDPKALGIVGGAYDEAMAEIAKDGKISDATRAKYEKLSERMGPYKMSDAEFDRKSERYNTILQNPDATPKDRADAARKLDEFRAMRTVPPSDQVKLDYADLLMRSGDKDKATSVLTAAVKANPELANNASFRVLAGEAGATTNKEFGAAIDKATGEKGSLKNWDRSRLKVIDGIEHLSHQMERFGATDTLTKQAQAQIDALAKRAAAEPDMKSFLDTHRSKAQRDLADAYTSADMKDKATAVMTQMLKESPDWVNSAWMRSAAQLNGSRGVKAFDDAANDARKKIPRQFDGQDP